MDVNDVEGLAEKRESTLFKVETVVAVELELLFLVVVGFKIGGSSCRNEDVLVSEEVEVLVRNLNGGQLVLSTWNDVFCACELKSKSFHIVWLFSRRLLR